MDFESATMLFQYLASNQSVINLQIEENLNDSYMDELGKLLARNKIIQSLSIGNRNKDGSITDAGISKLAPYLCEKNQTLKRLVLRMNSGITDASRETLTGIVKNTRIGHLNVKETGVLLDPELSILIARNNILNGGGILNLSFV